MKKPRLLLFALILCLLPVFAWAESAPLVLPEEVKPVELTSLLPVSRAPIEDSSDRAGGGSSALNFPVTEDVVSIDSDGSFSITTPDQAVLSSPQPFGWNYFTQSVISQPELYTQMGTATAVWMIENGIHLLYYNSLDSVEAQVYNEDPFDLSSFINDFDTMGDAGRAFIDAYMDMYGLTQYDLRLIGSHTWLYVGDLVSDHACGVYTTVLDGSPIMIKLLFHTDAISECEFFEEALADLDITASM